MSSGIARTPGRCRGAATGGTRTTSWSASSCSSRPRWTGWCRGSSRLRAVSRHRDPRRGGRGRCRRAVVRTRLLPPRAYAPSAGAEVVETGGELPTSVADLADLPGVGPYTAAAVASLAWGRDRAGPRRQRHEGRRSRAGPRTTTPGPRKGAVESRHGSSP